MNWVAADLPARFRREHSRRELFATDGVLTGRDRHAAVTDLRRNGANLPERA